MPHLPERIENSTGDYLVSTKNSQYCFDCDNIRDCKYCNHICMGASDCYDVDLWGNNMQLIYEVNCSGENVQDNAFGYLISNNAKNVFYSQFCLFGVEIFLAV